MTNWSVAGILMVLISCGGSPKPAEVGNPAPRPQLAEPKPAPAPAPAPSPPAPPPPTPPKKTVYEALRDTDGDIAGLAGFSIKRKTDPNHCGGIAIVTTRAKKVAKDDQALADVFALEFPTGLSFDDEHKTASLKKFNAFMQQLTTVGAASRAYYEKKMHDGDVVAKMAGAARMAQIFTRLASLLARAEIPLDVRTGDFAQDKIDAFCDRLVEVAEPMQGMAEQAMTECAAKKKIVNGGWWDPVCTAP
jgi:hypothetical protein